MASKIAINKPGFLFKSSNFCNFLTIRFRSNSRSMQFKHISNNVGRDFLLPLLAFATVTRKVLTQNLLQKSFSNQTFYVTITNADMGSLKLLYTLFDKYFDHMLGKCEQNRMVRNIQNFEVYCKIWLTIFEKVLMPFWKTFL